MKATLKLEDGREIQVELSDKDVDAIVKPKKTGWERVEPGQHYCYINGSGLVTSEREEEDGRDNLYYDNVNYFTDRDLANYQARAISLWLRIKRWAAENCNPVDWNDVKAVKYYIFYNNATGIIDIGAIKYYRHSFNIYFDTEHHAKKCIEKFQDDLLWYFTEYKERMNG